MPTITIPLTTYSIRENRPAYPCGSPANLTLRTATGTTHKILARVPLDRIPIGAVITSAKTRFWASAAHAGSTAVRVYPVTPPWKSSVTWATKPALGTLIATTTISGPVAGTLYETDVTTWASTRDRDGLTFDTTSSTLVTFYGSAASINKPVLVVDYYMPNDKPVNLSPQGGIVSVARPILAYLGDQDMDHQQIQYSSAGSVGTITFDTGSIPASSGRYVPAGGAPTLTAGQSTYWRVQTSGGGGTSPWSPWVQYTYRPIVAPVITNPPATTDDGSPTLTWTVTDQVSWQAQFFRGSSLIAQSPWDEDSVTRDWTPSKSIPSPGAHGKMILRTTDSYTPRVAAEGAPVWSAVVVEFDTVSAGAGPVVTDLAVTFDDPIPVITGTRTLGIPDEISLYRDDVRVPIWDADGNPHMWAPAADFFSGDDFILRDYTADLRQSHTWSVRTRVAGVVSGAGPSVTADFFTKSVWMVNPRTGEQVEILGNNDVPTVTQITEEGSVLHTPVHGGLVVEPVRRRLMRTTRSGGVEGLVLNADEDTLNDWALSDSGLKYRLIFGKVNWSIIFGDYSPTDVFYTDPTCDDTLVLVLFNWWERLADF